MNKKSNPIAVSDWRKQKEMGLLAGMLRHYQQDPDLVPDVLDTYKPEMWLAHNCKATAQIMRQMADEGEEHRLDLVAARLFNKMGETENGNPLFGPDISPSLWLFEIYEWDGHLGPATVRIAAQKLFEEHLKDLSLLALSEAMSQAQNPAIPLDVLASSVKNCFELLENNGMTESVDQLAEYSAMLETGEALPTPTPWENLNHALAGGVAPGELVVIGARPSVGKSALAINWAWNVADKGGNVAFFSLEMSRKQVFDRIAAKLAQINLGLFRGKMSQGLFEKVQAEALLPMAGKSLFVEDKGQITPAKIRQVCKSKHKLAPLSLIVIDYLQLVTPDEKKGNREQDVSSISRACKLLAKDLSVPVILLAQLNREAEKTGRAPKLSDLRESGAIEQDADTILFLHQDQRDANACIKRKWAEPLQVLIAKGRSTGKGFAKLVYDKPTQSILDMTKEHQGRMDLATKDYVSKPGNDL